MPPLYTDIPGDTIEVRREERTYPHFERIRKLGTH
jgi:hypothetical protein